ncbi:MAG TPA: hypothetical protein VFI31_25090 [Pirellulales bacterium]|nr:hypothetical protein [Pirellulales bacterium]
MKTRKAFLLRIEPRLYDELEAWAQQEMRSVNGQIEFLLHTAVERRKRAKGDERTGGATADSHESDDR